MLVMLLIGYDIILKVVSKTFLLFDAYLEKNSKKQVLYFLNT